MGWTQVILSAYVTFHIHSLEVTRGWDWLNIIFAYHMTESHRWATCYCFCSLIHWVKSTSNRSSSTSEFEPYVLWLWECMTVTFSSCKQLCACVLTRNQTERNVGTGRRNSFLQKLWQTYWLSLGIESGEKVMKVQQEN